MSRREPVKSPDIWFWTKHTADTKRGIRATYLCPDKHAAEQLARYVRKVDKVNARVYPRTVKAGGASIECHVVVSTTPKKELAG
jgi:hypothetical protein